MSDPLYQKLREDAGVILKELWHVLRSNTSVENRQHSPTVLVADDRQPDPLNQNSRRSEVLCYFHLN